MSEQLPLGAQGPVARRTDPETSHAAAASVERLRESQAAVLVALFIYGPAHDAMLRVRYDTLRANPAHAHWPRISDSGLRTRRRELCDMGYAEWTGEKVRMETGRLARTWRITEAGQAQLNKARGK